MSAIFGELLTFPQENGPDLRLHAFGDEHYARYETAEGFTAVYDRSLGLFTYGNIAGNRLVSTGVPVDQPPPAGLVRHLQESLAVIRAKVEEAHLLREAAGVEGHGEVVRTFGPNQGLLSGRQLSIGQVRGLTILVNFQDVSSTTTAADVTEMVNGTNYTQNGNICSVREYFLRVSSGKLDYTNTVVGPFKLSKKRESYINTLLVREALELAVANGVNLAQFDSRGEGIVDAVNILYAGQSLYQGDLWPHNASINFSAGGVRTDLYLLTGLGRNPSELSIGTFCHENGHLLCRFPDMYDYGKRDGDTQVSAGIGYYCLMGAGNHLDNGRSPAPVCAYLRDLAGWCDNVVDLNTPGTYEAVHGDYNTVMKYRTSKANEYFIVENRTQRGLDRSGPASGLAVYHCDTLGSNELQQGTATSHYQCALMQADGRRDLEANNNRGDASDLYSAVAGVALSSTSNPHSREWDGRDSELRISDIGTPDERIRFRVGTAAPITAQTASGSASPQLAIPDADPAGVASTIDLTASGIIRRIRVKVDITHTYIGDLVVELVSPTGRRALIHSRTGGTTNDLHADLDSNRPGELGNLVGQPMQGSWVLRVSDHEAVDVGILDAWSLDLEGA